MTCANERILEYISRGKHAAVDPTSPLWSEREFVLKVARHDYDVLDHAPAFVADKEVIRSAVRTWKSNVGGETWACKFLEKVSNAAYDDPDFAAEMIEECPGFYRRFPRNFFKSKEAALAFAKVTPRGLEKLKRFSGDKEVVLAAIGCDWTSVIYLENSLAKDPEVLVASVAPGNTHWRIIANDMRHAVRIDRDTATGVAKCLQWENRKKVRDDLFRE